MGRSGSSSKKKYSKKKSLKVSSEARRLKRIKRVKSKKLRRHDSSSSSPSCSDDDSTSSSPLSSSSSEVKYKSRKSRSHTRHEVKGSSKKRTRRRSCSEDSSDEYDSPPVKKRKRSKKNKKKMKKKKKHNRKDAYITSDSESCSTCYDDDNDNIESVMLENNPRRLKSVITVATKPDNEEGDDNDMKRDEIKEEMVYDYDYDYPSCKSNDSNDGETKKELDDQSNIDYISKEKGINDSDNHESGVVVDDLESILRKKALENLNRFRGGIQSQTKPVVVTTPVVDDNNNKQINDQSGGVTVSQQDSQPVIQRSRFTWRRDDAHGTYSGPESSRSQPPLVPKLQTAGLSSSTDRLENKTTNEISENKITNEILENKTNNTHESIEVKKSTGDLETPSSGSMKEGKQQSETNDNSQFEKKTMSVMRGGEMVQVSYKVYIPNRAPALARRKLTR